MNKINITMRIKYMKCHNNINFENSLTAGKEYKIIIDKVPSGKTYYIFKNDNGEITKLIKTNRFQ